MSIFITLLTVFSLAAHIQAFDIPFLTRRQEATCPSVWFDISTELTGMFLQGGECNTAARRAIRAIWHDCFPLGGCDGSISFPEELSRAANAPMTRVVNDLKALAAKYDVGVADMLAFAGSHAIATCPSGPIVQTFIGRKDATGPAPDGYLPAADISGDKALANFQAAGFDAKDLAALIGAHTVSRQITTDGSRPGTPQDSTSGIWDIRYYIETLANSAPFRFISDLNLSRQNEVGPWMQRFSTNKAAWDEAFVSAMARLELLGSDRNTMVDCTAALPRAQASSRREQKGSNMLDRTH